MAKAAPPKNMFLGCLAIFLILLGVGYVMGKPGQDARAQMAHMDEYNARRKAYESQHNQPVTLLESRVVARTLADGRPGHEVLLKWRNDGKEPVGMMWADVRVLDPTGTQTFDAQDECPYVIEPAEGTRLIQPGETYETPAGRGILVWAVDAGEPTQAEVTITYAGPEFPEEP